MTYSVKFQAYQNGDQYTNNTEIEMRWDEQPAWNQIAESFKQFLQSQGYVFDIDDRFDVVKEETNWPTDEEDDVLDFPEEDATPVRRKKSGKKRKAKLSKVK